MTAGTPMDPSPRTAADAGPCGCFGATTDLEDRLRQQALTQLLGSASPLGFLVVDNRTDDILYFNDRFCEIWGIEHLAGRMRRGELKNSDIIPACLPVLADIPAFAASCAPLQSELNRVVVDDEIPFVGDRTIRRHSSHLRGDDDRYFGRFYLFEEITERKRAEVALHESEAMFSAAFHSSPSAMVIQTLDGNVVEANRSLCELIGYRPEELHGRTPAQLGLVSDEMRLAVIAAMGRGGPLRNMEMQLRLRDGSVRDVVYAVELIRLRGSSHRLGTILDVTERNRAQEALRESEQRLASIVELAMDAIITLDESQRIVMFNAAAGTMFRCSPTEAIGQSIERFIPERFRGPHADQVRAFGAGRPQARMMGLRGPVTALRADGEEFPTEVSISHGEVRGRRIYSVILRDVSARMAAEAARDALEAQLRVAQKMEAIGTLASGIAHDFNNILGAIYGYTEMARQAAQHEPGIRELLDEVATASTRAAALVRQILAFSRQEKQQRQPIRLAPVVEEVLKLLRAAVPASITFEVSLAPDACLVLANATQIHQIVMNLGTNAAHAMRDRNGRLAVTLANCTLDAKLAELALGPYVRLSVADNGHGMDAATIERIFDPFFTTKAPGDGTGLGLSVVHGIMRSHEGAITVRSQPGVGTTFDLYFPAVLGAAPDLAVGASAIPRGNGEHILFVDDEEALGRLARRMLERLGYSVEVHHRPKQALEAVRARPTAYALVITDLTMPELRGVDLARQLRQIRPDLPIVLTSGYSADLSPAEAATAGILEVVHKPFSVEVLAVAIRRALRAPASG